MDDEILKNIWNTLTNDGATKSDFETWKTNFSGSDEVQNNVHTYLTDKKYTKSDIETWRTNVGITTSEKKNQVDTPITILTCMHLILVTRGISSHKRHL